MDEDSPAATPRSLFCGDVEPVLGEGSDAAPQPRQSSRDGDGLGTELGFDDLVGAAGQGAGADGNARRSVGSRIGRIQSTALAPVEADFWCGGKMLAPYAQRNAMNVLDQLLKGDPETWNTFDMTLRQIEAIYNKIMLRMKAAGAAVGGSGESGQSAAHRVMHTELHNHHVDLCVEAFPRILMRFKLRDWRDISLPQFAFMFRRLKLAELFCDETLLVEQRCMACCTSGVLHGVLHIMDYTPMEIIPATGQWPLDHGKVKEFFFQPQSHRFGSDYAPVLAEDRPVCWIHMRHLDPIMLLRLAIKYHRHPLHVEDALLMKRQPSKIERTGADYFCAINLLQLLPADTQDQNASAHADPSTHMDAPAPVALQCSFISMFVFRRSTTDEHDPDPQGSADTCISIYDDSPIQVEDQLRGHAHVSRSNRRFKSKWTSPQLANAAKGGGAGGGEGGGQREVRDIFAAIKKEISLSSTRQREHGPEFIMYAVLDKTVDELIPICEAYLERLAWFQRLSPPALRLRLNEVAQIKLEAKEVYRTVRPMVGMIKVRSGMRCAVREGRV